VNPLVGFAIMVGIDWDQVMMRSNARYDRLVAANRLPPLDKRAALRKIKADLDEDKAWPKGWSAVGVMTGPGKTKRMGQILAVLLISAPAAVGDAEDRFAMTLDLTRIACALAAYGANHGSYPRELNELKPEYLAQVPDDIFTGAALKYSQQPGGYLLHSLGVNGRDDEGKTIEDAKVDEDFDDLVVRVPAAKESP
jgi:hypothetical protein